MHKVHKEKVEIKEEPKSCENEHIESMHEEKQTFECEMCSKKVNMKQHAARVHEKKKAFKCEICYKDFSLKQHMTTHVAINL